MSEQTLSALRLVVYHQLSMWDATREAEKLLGHEIDSRSDELDYLCSGPMTLSEKTLIKTFGLRT